MLNLSVSPWLAAIPLGIGAGGLFPIALMLPIDETNNAQEASAWSAMTQSGGYILGALGPLALGWLHDTTGSFVQAFYGLATIIVLQIIVQLAIGNKKALQQFMINQSPEFDEKDGYRCAMRSLEVSSTCWFLLRAHIANG